MFKNEIKTNVINEEEFCKRIRENAKRAGYYETLPTGNLGTTLCFAPSNNSKIFARMYDPLVTIDYSSLNTENKINIKAELDQRVYVYVIIICIIIAINVVRCYFGNAFGENVYISYVILSFVAAFFLLAIIRHNQKVVCSLFLENI